MKLFSFRKIVTIKNGHITINDLARNHAYKVMNKYLVVNGIEENTGQPYTVYYSPNGKFKFIRLKGHQRSVSTLCWRQEYDLDTSEIITSEGNTFLEISKYSTNDEHICRLIYRSFTSIVNGTEARVEFELRPQGWLSTGCIPQNHKEYWINH